MAQHQNKTLKMIYKDQLKYVECPRNAKYKECIEIALKIFGIPSKYKQFIQITNEFDAIFDKCSFDCYNLLFPSPRIYFFIKIDNEEIKSQRSKDGRKPFAKLSNKRKHRDEMLGVPVTRHNCFLGSFPGMENGAQESEEPKSKKHKSSLSESRDVRVVRRTTSRRLNLYIRRYQKI